MTLTTAVKSTSKCKKKALPLRSKIFIKLLLTLLFTLASIVVMMFIIVNWSFQQGFSNYLQQGELKRVASVAVLFSSQYKEQQSWDFMQHNRKNWRDTLELAGVRMPPSPPPPQRADRAPPRPNNNRRPPPRHSNNAPIKTDTYSVNPTIASISLARRISLFNAQRKPVFGRVGSTDIDYWVAIKSGQQTIGWLGLQATAMQTDQLAINFIAQQQENYLYITVAVLLLSLFVAAVLGRQLSQPIHRLAQGSKRVAAGDYTTRILVKGNDELAELSEDFNEMTQILQHNEQLRKQWISDISHELRTPIAVISAETEALLDGVRQPTHQRISSLYSEIGSLSQLVDDLHQLSLSDHNNLELHKTEINLTAVINTLLIKFTPRMQEKNISCRFESASISDIYCFADKQRINQLLNNLLENSLRYTDSGGDSKIALSHVNNQLKIEFIDTAPGVPHDQLALIFERLYRVDKSRSRLVGGSGLGLSICKNIISAHNGDISAQNNPDGGLKVTVLLPLHYNITQ
ncbi:MAG: two-component system sensor histidine kinase BaeS [Oceanospirillaceae bacterium]